jgi:hypothetical protein
VLIVTNRTLAFDALLGRRPAGTAITCPGSAAGSSWPPNPSIRGVDYLALVGDSARDRLAVGPGRELRADDERELPDEVRDPRDDAERVVVRRRVVVAVR